MRLALAILLPGLAMSQVKSFDVATVKPAARGPLGLRRASGGPHAGQLPAFGAHSRGLWC